VFKESGGSGEDVGDGGSEISTTDVPTACQSRLMIINVGNRTDIPAFYSQWFYRRLEEGSVCVRNPYVPHLVTRYKLQPDLVDAFVFCSKNPAPMLSEIDKLSGFQQFWFISITPYGRDIEPRVPPFSDVIGTAGKLSTLLGKKAVVWRYDPVFIGRSYNLDFHLKTFEYMAYLLEGVCEVCVISFVDLYKKTLRNFPDVKEVSPEDQHFLSHQFVKIAATYGMRVKSCAESRDLDVHGIDSRGCFTKKDLEDLTGLRYMIPKKKSKRESCDCLLENEIGAYNSCPHGCLYCYANFSKAEVRKNWRDHDPDSPLLIGHLRSDDEIRDAVQQSYLEDQLSLF
jgi:hypothetical protein